MNIFPCKELYISIFKKQRLERIIYFHFQKTKTGKNYIFPFLNTISEELKVQISESLAGIWITPPSFYLPTMMKIVNCPSCPIFWKFIDNFFLLYCDLYGCGLSTVYSSATAVGVCLPRISDIVYVLAIWNMMTYSGCENCDQWCISLPLM
jgi:hypothetical protein